MQNIKEKWLKELGNPSYEIPKEPIEFIKKYDCPEFTLELYNQKNGPDTYQRVMIAIPKNITLPCPAVAIPFYYPESMLEVDPEGEIPQEKLCKISMMSDLTKRGFITVSADAYHITYTKSPHVDGAKAGIGYGLWAKAGAKLREDEPTWTGMGKLVSDTSLLVDVLEQDERVDSTRIGIAGHSLGGKMAFYTGCLDERIKVILASDFGIGWDQTNWRDIWYWHTQVEELIEKGMDHSELLGLFAPKPFCLIAGQYDNEESWEMMCKAPGYEKNDEKLKIINHATGHTPPDYALDEGYKFIEKWL